MQVCDEVCRNTKNKRKVERFKEYKCANITKIYNILKNREYKVGPYIHFTLYEPKKREIVSQGMIDKIINHLVSRYILYPAILPCLIDKNVASRAGLGTKAGLDASKEFHRKCKVKYGKYYILKCDISKFFASIDKEILKEKLSLNKKSMILTSNNNFIFLGRDKKGKYARYRRANKKLKHRKYLYSQGEINLMEYSTSILTYR